MINFCTVTFPPLSIGDEVTITVPTVDRGPLDFSSIRGIVIDKKNDLYQIGTKAGLIKEYLPRTDLIKCNSKEIELEKVPKGSLISLREAASHQSMTGGQGFRKCACKSAKKLCGTKTCKCFKAGVPCNSRCHTGLCCLNKQK